jgi:hypothetical protein
MPIFGRVAFDYRLRGATFGVFEGSFRVPAMIHSPLLPAAVIGKVSNATIYVSTQAICRSLSACDVWIFVFDRLLVRIGL